MGHSVIPGEAYDLLDSGTGDEGLTTSPAQDSDADRRVGLDAGEPGSLLFVHTVAAASARPPNQTS